MKQKILMLQLKELLNLLLVIIILVAIQLLLPVGNIIYACGLFAFIGDNPTKYFSWDKFNTLGLFNDSRGGDACGRIVGNRVMWGVDKFKKYEDFASEIAPNPLHVKDNVVLGHCRRASSGGKVDIYAQPVVLFRKDIDMSKIKDAKMLAALADMKESTIVFSGIHNGTIDNYIELANKYKIPIENHNDSRVLLSILFYGDYTVLKEYVGYAALIWHNHILNKTYLFKGESKSWSTVSVTSEERPLFAWEVAKNNYYLSSTPESLRFIQTKKTNVIEIKSNTLYKFIDGVPQRSVKYDRSLCTQNKSYSESNYASKSNHKVLGAFRGQRAIGSYESEYNRYEHDSFDDRDANINYDAWGEDLPWEEGRINFKTGEKFVRQFSINGKEGFRAAFEKTDKYSSRNLKKVVYNKTRYWMNGGLMHGIYVLSQGGIVPTNTYMQGMIILKPYYFIEGIMLDGMQAYKVASKLHEEFLQDITDLLLDNQSTEEQFTFHMAKYSRYPIIPLLNNSSSECCYSPTHMGPDPLRNLFSGDYQPLFSYMKYKFQNGELISIEETKQLKTPPHDLNDDTNTKLYLDLVRKTTPMDWTQAVGSNLLLMESYRNPLSPFQKYLIDNCNLNYGNLSEEGIFIINYLRDFNSDMISDCRMCANEDTTIITTCHRCAKLLDIFTGIKTKKLYGIYG